MKKTNLLIGAVVTGLVAGATGHFTSAIAHEGGTAEGKGHASCNGKNKCGGHAASPAKGKNKNMAAKPADAKPKKAPAPDDASAAPEDSTTPPPGE